MSHEKCNSDLIWYWLPAEATLATSGSNVGSLEGHEGPGEPPLLDLQSWHLAQWWNLTSWKDISQLSLLNISSPLTFHQMKRSLGAGKCSSSHLLCSQFSRANNYLRQGSTGASLTLRGETDLNGYTQAAGWCSLLRGLYDANVSSALCVSVCVSWRGWMM